MSLFKKASETTNPFKTDTSPSKSIFSAKPYASQEKPSFSSTSGGGQSSPFKPTSPFQAFTRSEPKHHESELKAPNMKPLSPEGIKGLRTNQEIVKEIQKDNRSHVPVNNDTLQVLVKRMDNLYGVQKEEGKESPFIRQNNGAYLSDGTLVNSVLRDWIKSFEHSHKLQKFTTLRLFDRYLFAQDFLIPNREKVVKAIQLKNELGSEEAAMALQTELYQNHTIPLHKFIILELRAIHQALYLLKNEGGILGKIKLNEYMKCIRESVGNLKKGVMSAVGKEQKIEYELHQVIEAIQLHHWLIDHSKEIPKDSFTLEELISLLQIPYFCKISVLDRTIKSFYYWTVLLILQILRFMKQEKVKEDNLQLLERVREDETSKSPNLKKFLKGILELVINKRGAYKELRALDYWNEVKEMLLFIHQEQIEPTGVITTLVHWTKEIDKQCPLSFLSWGKEQNKYLRFLSYFCSLFPEVTQNLQGLKVTDDIMQHFPVNFSEMIYFLSFMADYSFERGGEPSAQSTRRVNKLFMKLQNLKLLHIQMNEDKYREAFGEEGMRALGRCEKDIKLIKNMMFSQIYVESHTHAVLEHAEHDSIYVLFEKNYSAWRILLQMGNVWHKKLNNPIVERNIISEDTKLIAILLRAISGFVLHDPQILEMLSQELRKLDPEQHEDQLDLSILFNYLIRIAYAGCQFLPQESEEVVAGVLNIILLMLKYAPLETIGMLYSQLTSGDLNLLHQICNANLHKEQQFLATLQMLAITEELLHPQLIHYSLSDTRYGEVLLWFLEAGFMRMVCSIQTARFDHLKHYFMIYSSCLSLIGRIADLCCINPLRYPLILYDGVSEVAKEGSSLASNLIQVLHLIPVIDFIEKALDFVPLRLKYNSEKYEPNIWSSIKNFKTETPLWQMKLAEAQTQALFALNKLLDLTLSTLILKYPKHEEMQKKITQYVQDRGGQVIVYTGVPCLEASFIDDLLKAVKLIKPRSSTIRKDQPLLPLPLDIIQLIGSSYKLDHCECSQPHFEEIERESVLALSKIILVWELSDTDSTHQLTTLYPGSLNQSAEEARALVKKLTLIPQSPFSYLNTVQVVVQILNLTALTQPQFFKLILAESSFLQLLIESSVKETAPIQHSYTCFSLISILLNSEFEVTIRNKTHKVNEYVASICMKITFFQKLLSRLSLKYSQIINEHDFVSELDKVASDRPDRYKIALNEDNFSILAKIKIIQTIIFELLLYALNHKMITRQKVASALQKAPLAVDLQTSYLELSKSINAANFILKNLKMLGSQPPVQLFETAIKQKLSSLIYKIYMQVNTSKATGSVGEVLNAFSYPLFFSTETNPSAALNLLKFQGFDSIPFKYGANFLYDESELVAQFADKIGRSPRDLQKATIIIHAANYIMSLISLQGAVLSSFHSLTRTAFKLIPEKETIAFTRLNQSSSFKLLGSILQAKRESIKQEDHHELKYSSLFNPKHLNYFESLLQGSWGSLCQELKIPQLSRLYNCAQRAAHLGWLVAKNSQHIQIDRNRYWRKNYPRFCEEHKSADSLGKQIRSFLNSFIESIQTPLDELLDDFVQHRETPFLSLYIANIISDLLSALFQATNYHSLYEMVIIDTALFQKVALCVQNYFKRFSFYYEPCLKLARNSVLLLSDESGQFLPKVKQLFSSSIFQFLNNSKEGRPSELDQLRDELKLLLLYYSEMGSKAEPCFATDIVELFMSSNLVNLIQNAQPNSQELECLILVFQILAQIFNDHSHGYHFERSCTALIHTYTHQILSILSLFDKEKNHENYTQHFTLKNLHTTLRLINALGKIFSFRAISGGQRFWQHQLQSRVVRGICDAVILGCLSLFNTRMSFEKSYHAQNELELELQRKKFKTDKHPSQQLIKLRDFTTGSVEYSHLQNYNPNFFIVVVERILQLNGTGLCDLLNAILPQSKSNNSRAVSYFSALWTRDDYTQFERGQLGLLALDKLEDLVMFLKYLLCKAVAWEMEVKEALEELRAIAIVDEEVEAYHPELIHILKTIDLSFKFQNVGGGLKKAIGLLETLLKTGRTEYATSYGHNKHINEAFDITEDNLEKSKALLRFTKLD